MPRVSARTHADSGFIFLNNHTRNAAMPARPGFQVRLTLPGDIMRVPQEPITFPSDVYGIWPVNLDLNGVRLRYSTAQLMNRLEHDGETFVFFFALPGVVPEFFFDTDAPAVTAHGFSVRGGAKALRLHARAESGDILVRSAGKPLHLVLLSQNDAENLWKVNDGHALLLTKADVFSNGPETTLRQADNSVFQFSLFHASTNAGKRVGAEAPLFTRYRGSVPSVPLDIAAHATASAQLRTPLEDGPAVAWRKSPIPMAPDDPEFAHAARWAVTIRGNVNAPQLADIFVRIQYQGDVARIRQNGHLVDDDFWNGSLWTISMHYATLDPALPFVLEVLPFPQTFSMYLQSRAETAETASTGTVANLRSVKVVPSYS